MSASHPVVHAVDISPPADAAAPRIQMENFIGTPGTYGGASLRLIQLLFVAAALCIMMTAGGFSSVLVFWWFIVVVCMMLAWSVALASLDVYALLVRQHLQDCRIFWMVIIGDGVICTSLTVLSFASAGVVVVVGEDFMFCSQTNCTHFSLSTFMGLMCSFTFFFTVIQSSRSL